MASIGGSSGSGRSSSSTSRANRSSSTSTVSRPATTPKAAAPTKGVGHGKKDTFTDGKLPQCEVILVKGNTGRAGVGVNNDVCTFDPPTGPIMA